MKISTLTSKRSKAVWAIILFFLISLSKTAWSEDGKRFKPKLSIQISSGLDYLNIGDINTYLTSYDKYMTIATNYKGGMLNKLHYVPDIEGEIRFDISSKFAISFGIGLISGKKESYLVYKESDPHNPDIEYNNTHYIQYSVKAKPLKLGGYYILPLTSRINSFLNGGLVHYSSQCSIYYHHSSTEHGVPSEWWIDVESSNFGIFGGIGFEYNLTNFLALAISVQGRYAKIKNLKGGSGVWLKNDGYLYLYERYLPEYDVLYTYITISSVKPNGDDFLNVRKAVLDLSGFSLKATIRIKLF